MEDSYRIESILFLLLRQIGITRLIPAAVAGCVKSQCTQEIGVFHCWLRIFLFVGERVGLGERRRRGGRHGCTGVFAIDDPGFPDKADSLARNGDGGGFAGEKRQGV